MLSWEGVIYSIRNSLLHTGELDVLYVISKHDRLPNWVILDNDVSSLLRIA